MTSICYSKIAYFSSSCFIKFNFIAIWKIYYRLLVIFLNHPESQMSWSRTWPIHYWTETLEINEKHICLTRVQYIHILLHASKHDRFSWLKIDKHFDRKGAVFFSISYWWPWMIDNNNMPVPANASARKLVEGNASAITRLIIDMDYENKPNLLELYTRSLRNDLK